MHYCLDPAGHVYVFAKKLITAAAHGILLLILRRRPREELLANACACVRVRVSTNTPREADNNTTCIIHIYIYIQNTCIVHTPHIAVHALAFTPPFPHPRRRPQLTPSSANVACVCVSACARSWPARRPARARARVRVCEYFAILLANSIYIYIYTLRAYYHRRRRTSQPPDNRLVNSGKCTRAFRILSLSLSLDGPSLPPPKFRQKFAIVGYS